jgi:SNF2 family DNA or RNA helicase
LSTQDASPLIRDLDLEPEIDVNWKEGIEEFQKMSRDDLWKALGLPKGSLPFFNKLEDPSGINDPWTPEGKEWFRVSGNGKPLDARWHQLVGPLKMLLNAFAGLPALLMDDVGLGKTIQVAIFIAILAYYRDYYASHGSFPGIFGESCFPQCRSTAADCFLPNSKSEGVESRRA